MSSTNLTVERKASVKNGIGRMMISVTVIAIEIYITIGLFFFFIDIAAWVQVAARVFAVILVLWIHNSNRANNMKLSWIILVLAAPVIGTSLFLIAGLNVAPKKMRKRYRLIDEELLPRLVEGTAGEKSETAVRNL